MTKLNPILSNLKIKDDTFLREFMKNIPEDVASRISIRHIPKGDTLITNGDIHKEIYILVSGKLQAMDELIDGSIYPFIEFSPFEIIGELEVFTEDKLCSTTITAVTNSCVLVISKNDFLTWMKKDNEALFRICVIITKRLTNESIRNRNFLFLDSAQRLASYFVKIFKSKPENEGYVIINKKRQEIADETGFSVKTVNRAIKKMEILNLLSMQRGKVKIDKLQYSKLVEYYKNKVFYGKASNPFN